VLSGRWQQVESGRATEEGNGGRAEATDREMRRNAQVLVVLDLPSIVSWKGGTAVNVVIIQARNATGGPKSPPLALSSPPPHLPS